MYILHYNSNKMDISDLLILFTCFKYFLCPLTHSNLTVSETNCHRLLEMTYN